MKLNEDVMDMEAQGGNHGTALRLNHTHVP